MPRSDPFWWSGFWRYGSADLFCFCPQDLWRWTARLSPSTTTTSTPTAAQRVSPAARLQAGSGSGSDRFCSVPERKYSAPTHHTTEHVPEKKFKSEALLSTLTSDASKENTPGRFCSPGLDPVPTGHGTCPCPDCPCHLQVAVPTARLRPPTASTA